LTIFWGNCSLFSVQSLVILAIFWGQFPASGAAEARAHSWFGTWKLNPAKSTANPDSQVKRTTVKIEPWGEGLKVVYDMVGVRGGVTHMEWTGKFDGMDYPVQGVDFVLTHAYRRTGDRSYEITVKVDGSLAATASVVISPDGRTLTSVTTERNPQGRTLQTTSVYEKQ